jgi:hypothetical protein
VLISVLTVAAIVLGALQMALFAAVAGWLAVGWVRARVRRRRAVRAAVRRLDAELRELTGGSR